MLVLLAGLSAVAGTPPPSHRWRVLPAGSPLYAYNQRSESVGAYCRPNHSTGLPRYLYEGNKRSTGVRGEGFRLPDSVFAALSLCHVFGQVLLCCISCLLSYSDHCWSVAAIHLCRSDHRCAAGVVQDYTQYAKLASEYTACLASVGTASGYPSPDAVAMTVPVPVPSPAEAPALRPPLSRAATDCEQAYQAALRNAQEAGVSMSS